jgi:hypothetical protein
VYCICVVRVTGADIFFDVIVLLFVCYICVAHVDVKCGDIVLLFYGLYLRCLRCSIVVKALCYKPEGRRFETR